MEQESSPIQPQQQEVRPKAPIFVTIIAGLILISSIRIVLPVIVSLLTNTTTYTTLSLIIGFVMGSITLAWGIGLVAVSFGIWKMRRWALYTFTGLAALTIFTALSTKDLEYSINAVIQVLALVYLWAINKRFN